VATLWSQGLLPIHDGLYEAAGPARTVRIDPTAPGGLVLMELFDVDELLRADPDYVTSIDITTRLDLPAGAGRLCCGEGSYGSEGFFARTDANGQLVWVVYLERSNPFTEVNVDDRRALFTSTSGVRIAVAITTPDFQPADT
jgi:hypothetical protein